MSDSDRRKITLPMVEGAIRTTLVWKYAFLVLLIGFVGFVTSYDPATQKFNFKLILENVLSGVIASLLLSIIYDVFTKRQQVLQTKVDQETLLNDLSRETFLTRGVDSLTDSDLKTLTAKLTADDRFLKSLADLTSERGGFATNVLNAYFRPLWRTSATEFYSWDNKLIPDPDDSNQYLWKSRQRFQQRFRRKIFRVAITDKSTIGVKLLNCPLQFDSVLVLNDLGHVRRSSYPTRELVVKVDYTRDDRRRTDDLTAEKRDLDDLRLADYLSNEQLQRIVVYEFTMPEGIGSDALIDFQFVNRLSFNEPYFFVQADDLCFVSDINIDYNDIRSRLDAVWPASFIGNLGAQIDHDELAHTIVARVDGALMPGQGIAIIWKLADEAPAKRRK